MPFCNVKGALLKCKRRPFTWQNMPFYKLIHNHLYIRRLQNHKKNIFNHSTLNHPSQFVSLFYHKKQHPSWVLFSLLIPYYISCAIMNRPLPCSLLSFKLDGKWIPARLYLHRISVLFSLSRRRRQPLK